VLLLLLLRSNVDELSSSMLSSTSSETQCCCSHTDLTTPGTGRLSPPICGQYVPQPLQHPTPVIRPYLYLLILVVPRVTSVLTDNAVVRCRWLGSLVVSALNLRLDGREFDFQPQRLILGWVTVFGRASHRSISPSHPGQLSLLPSAGQEMSTRQSAVTLCG